MAFFMSWSLQLNGAGGISTKPVVIVAKKSESNVDISLNDSVLTLGQTKIKRWSYAAPKCDGCDLTVSRRHFPDGPNIQVQLTSPSNLSYQWLLVESWQKRLNLTQWHIEKIEEGIVVRSKVGNVMPKLGESKQLDNCLIHVLWIESYQSKRQQTSPGKALGVPAAETTRLSDDGPNQRMQLLVQCS